MRCLLFIYILLSLCSNVCASASEAKGTLIVSAKVNNICSISSTENTISSSCDGNHLNYNTYVDNKNNVDNNAFSYVYYISIDKNNITYFTIIY